jgi:hypothetical protein
VRVAAAAAVLLLVAAGCGSSGAHDGAALPRPAGDYSATVDNPWFPLRPGSKYVYTGAKDGEPSRELVTVTHRTRTIADAECVEVRDNLYLSGRLGERTTDWYSQDGDGNVWYFGEATAELDRKGRVTSTEGSWLAGRNGAQPGIFMPAHPKVGATFRQEFYKGHAEDHFRVQAIGVPVSVPYGSWTHAMKTREWTPLEPGAIDFKWYVLGLGPAATEQVRAADRAERLRGALLRLVGAQQLLALEDRDLLAAQPAVRGADPAGELLASGAMAERPRLEVVRDLEPDSTALAASS